MAQIIGSGPNGQKIVDLKGANQAARKTADQAAKKDKSPLSTGSGSSVTSVNGFSSAQLRNAKIIVSVGKSMGMSSRDIQIALMTAMQESDLRNLGSTVYGETRQGAQGMGSDHDSVGLFQQRPQSGWGTPNELMNPATAASKFFNALKKVGSRDSMSLTRAAQAVQRSAFPDAYAKHAGGAATLLRNLGGISAKEANKFIAQAGSSGGGGGGGGGSSSSSSGGGGDSFKDTWSEKDFKAALASAGFGSYLINSSSELKKKFAQAIAGEWTADRFAGEIRGTKWYRSRSNTQREYDTLRKNDPTTWQQELDRRRSDIGRIAKQIGASFSDKRLDALASSAYRNGVSDNDLYRMVAAEVDFDPKKAYAGDIGSTENAIKKAAADYGVSMSNDNLGTSVERVLRGDNTLEGLTNYYKEQAKKNYGHFAKELDAGQTLRQIADPYITRMGNILELNPTDINLDDKTIQKGLLQKNPKDNTTSSMTTWQFEDLLRNDSRWLKTNNARQSLMSVGHNLLQSFGLAV